MYKVLTKQFDSLALALAYASEQAVRLGIIIHIVDYRGAVVWSSN